MQNLNKTTKIIVLTIAIVISYSFLYFQVKASGILGKTQLSLTDGLVGHWTFDGKDMINQVDDVSGTGNHGTISGQTSTSTVIGKMGQALNFDGDDDYVDVSDDDSLDLVTWTLGAWVNFDTKANYMTQAAKRNSGGYQNYFLQIDNSASQIFSTGFREGGGTYRRAKSTTVPAVNTWYYVVGTYDGAKVKIVFVVKEKSILRDVKVIGNQQIKMGDIQKAYE